LIEYLGHKKSRIFKEKKHLARRALAGGDRCAPSKARQAEEPFSPRAIPHFLDETT